MEIAIVGSGISGNAAAWALSRKHKVTVYEKRDRLGGHTATKRINDKGGIAVDTGFIVYNEQNYPLLVKLFDYLGVETQETEMAFSVSLDGGKIEWCGTGLKGVFAQRKNLFSPSFLYMLRDIFKFNRRAKKDLQSGALCGLTLDDYLKNKGFSKRLKEDYLIPMTSAIWSTPSQKMLEFPAESLVRFMKNHSLMQSKRPIWRTVCGGSHTYVDRIKADTKATYSLGNPVLAVSRTSNGKVDVTESSGKTRQYDHVIFACHTDQARAILTNPTETEAGILEDIKYTENDVWLHQDPALMPKRKNAWAAWNYLGDPPINGERKVSVTYWMNLLQNIRRDVPLFVTLNPLKHPDPEKVIGRYSYDHPLFDAAAVAAQGRLSAINGQDRISFCGAWTGFGFHEDGLRSGLKVAEGLGCAAPWETEIFERPILAAAE